MNIYVVVEGKSERIVYESWIPLLNVGLLRVAHPSLAAASNYYLLAAGGYPEYFETIELAIEDIRSYRAFDRLVVSIDSEDMTYEEKYEEVEQHLKALNCPVEYRILVQHFCLETWALANRTAVDPRPSRGSLLRRYKDFFDVRTQDPELLPPYPIDDLNRAQFAYKYLRIALNAKYHALAYSKDNPRIVCNPKYLQRITERHFTNGHIRSLAALLTAFR